MNQTMNPAFEIIRPLLAIISAGGLWLGNQVTQTVAPDFAATGWGAAVEKFGLPAVLLALSIYGGIGLYKALRASETARIQDAKDALASYKVDMEKAEISRERMIRELTAQTQVLKDK